MSVVGPEDWKGKAEELLKTRKLTMSGRLRRIIARCELLWMVEVEVAVLCCSGVRCGKQAQDQRTQGTRCDVFRPKLHRQVSPRSHVSRGLPPSLNTH